MGVSGRSLEITVPNLSISAKCLYIFINPGLFFSQIGSVVLHQRHAAHRTQIYLTLKFRTCLRNDPRNKALR